MNISLLKSRRYARFSIGSIILLLIIIALLLIAPLNVQLARAATNTTPAYRFDDPDIELDLMQTGRGGTSDEVSGALVFRVQAYDPTVGNRDGDGIDHVDLSVLDADGNEVYRRRENQAGYCAFGGGDPNNPNCTTYVFAQHGNRWPDQNGERGDSIRDEDEYTLRATATAQDGRSTTRDFPVMLGLAKPSDLAVDLVQTTSGQRTFIIRNTLIFRVRANDPTVGKRDGAGIDNVDMIIIDEEGREVYRHREEDAGYCAFGGGTPNCTVYVFGQHGNRWPDQDDERGEPIQRGEQYTLRAIVNAEDGRSTTLDTRIVIRP